MKAVQTKRQKNKIKKNRTSEESFESDEVYFFLTTTLVEVPNLMSNILYRVGLIFMIP